MADTKVRGRRSRKGGTTLTAYEAAKRVNEALKEAGFEKRIPPQMMYNYTHARVREGKRPLIRYSKTKGIDQADFDLWLSNYIDKQSQEA